ncbi:hypothetical protein BGW80DRAFT_746061 [Lactifluus volemus]|nr:hypothetical protein BGW80DRAFT_746061 [Lactifluus volemus]
MAFSVRQRQLSSLSLFSFSPSLLLTRAVSKRQLGKHFLADDITDGRLWTPQLPHSVVPHLAVHLTSSRPSPPSPFPSSRDSLQPPSAASAHCGPRSGQVAAVGRLSLVGVGTCT